MTVEKRGTLVRSLILGTFFAAWSALCPAAGAGGSAGFPSAASDAGITSGKMPAGDTESVGDTASPTLRIDVTGNEISVLLENAPLRDVLARVSAMTGIRVFVRDEVGPHPLNDSFSAMDLGQAMQRLLEGTNFVLVYDRETSRTAVAEVFVLPEGETLPVGETTQTPTATADVRNRFETLDAVSLPESARAALLAGVDPLDPSQLPEEALARMRVDALTALAERLEANMGENETTRRLREHINQLPAR